MAFNQLGFDIVFHVGVIMPVYVRKIADKSGISVKDGLHGFQVTLTRLYNGFIGEKSIFHGYLPPFPGVTAAMQAGYAAPLCFWSARTLNLFLFTSCAGSNTERFPLSTVPATGTGRQHFGLSSLDYPPAKPGGAVNGGQ